MAGSKRMKEIIKTKRREEESREGNGRGGKGKGKVRIMVEYENEDVMNSVLYSRLNAITHHIRAQHTTQLHTKTMTHNTTLQRTATYTTIHYNTLKHTATHCNVQQQHHTLH